MGKRIALLHQNPELRANAGIVPDGQRALHRDPDLGGRLAAQEIERVMERTREVVHRVAVANPAHPFADGEAEHPIDGHVPLEAKFETTHKKHRKSREEQRPERAAAKFR
jgi:hypothetical protein